MLKLETVGFERNTPINVGDVIRTHYGEDLIITGISRRKRKGATLSYIRPYCKNGLPEIALVRETMFRAYGYDITFNRSMDS